MNEIKDEICQEPICEYSGSGLRALFREYYAFRASCYFSCIQSMQIQFMQIVVLHGEFDKCSLHILNENIRRSRRVRKNMKNKFCNNQ